MKSDGVIPVRRAADGSFTFNAQDVEVSSGYRELDNWDNKYLNATEQKYQITKINP